MDDIDKDQFIDGVRHLDKKSQVELLRSLMQQLEPEIVAEAAQDTVIQVNSGNNSGSNVTYSDLVINLYCNENNNDFLANLLDAAAHRLRNSSKEKKPEKL